MSRDYGVNTVLTGTDHIPLFYDEHTVVDRPFTLKAGEVVSRGDIVYFEEMGMDYDDAVAGEANTGDGTLDVSDANVYQLANGAETITFTYQLGTTNWAVEGSETGVISAGTDFSAAAWAGSVLVTITAGGVAFADGDTFTVDVYPVNSAGAMKALTETNIASGSVKGVLIAGRDTDATNGPEPTFGYAAGVFNANAIGNWATLVADAGTGDADNIITHLQEHGIHVKEGLK